MFAIQVEYLTGRVYAGLGGGSTPEWPPHPARLFSALVAACFETGLAESAVEALRRLEREGPPCIQAGMAGEWSRTVCYVPTNYPAKNGSTLPWQRSKQPRCFPAHSPDSGIVHFIWPEAELSGETRRLLDEMAKRVGYLGKSASLVRMRVVQDAPEPTYVPDDGGAYQLRIFATGTFEELERRYKASRWEPSSAPWKRYSKVGDSSPPVEAINGPFGEMIVLRRTRGAPLGAESTLTLTIAARRALMKLADEHNLLSPLLHGHQGEVHCAWVALPFAGRRYADGRLMGLALAIPRGVDRAERRGVVAAAGALESIHLPKPLEPWRVELAGLEAHTRTLQPETWQGPAHKWGTVTPILLDRFPKRKHGVEEILSTSCLRAGLPQPSQLQHGPYSTVEGIPPVPEFRLSRGPDDKPRWGVHATVWFERPVRGPILLGAGRFFGLGLLRPMEDHPQ